MRTTLVWPLVAAILIPVSCDRLKPSPGEPVRKGEPAPVVQVEPEPVPVVAVCVADRLAFWTGPTQKEGFTGYYIKNGEAVTWLGIHEQDKDDKTREFYKVRLSDGTEGWALAAYVVPEARAAAVTEATTVYKQNNLISRTDATLQPMDIVAVVEEQDDWVRVVKGARSNVNWIKPGSLTFAEVDVAVAYHAGQANKAEGASQKKERLQVLLEEEAFQDSIFVPMIRAEVEGLEEQAKPPQQTGLPSTGENTDTGGTGTRNPATGKAGT